MEISNLPDKKFKRNGRKDNSQTQVKKKLAL